MQNIMLFIYSIVAICSVLCSCGLPDIIPQINKPAVSSNSANIITIASGDKKSDNTNYGIYGIDVFYKIYKRADASSKLNSDFSLVSNTISDPRTILAQNGFKQIKNNKKSEAENSSSPNYSILEGNIWSVTIDFSTGSKGTINIYVGSTINSNPSLFYRAVLDSSTSSYKDFSVQNLVPAQDSDLSHLRSDSGFNTSDASYGIILYVFAQDYDWSYLPLFSPAIMLGPFEIN